MKKIVYTTMVALLLVACSKESDDTGSGTGGGGESGGVTEVTPVTSDLTVNLTTDKACYRPGESVSFTSDRSVISNIVIFTPSATPDSSSVDIPIPSSLSSP